MSDIRYWRPTNFGDNWWYDVETTFPVIRPYTTNIGTTFSNNYLIPMNIVEYDKEIIIEIELAGFDEKDLCIEVINNELKVHGKINRNKRDDVGKIIQLEKIYENFSFEKSYILPNNVDKNNIEAKFINGLLIISLKKCEHALVKKIEITS